MATKTKKSQPSKPKLTVELDDKSQKEEIAREAEARGLTVDQFVFRALRRLGANI
jgi:hypothetical protein